MHPSEGGIPGGPKGQVPDVDAFLLSAACVDPKATFAIGATDDPKGF